ncbi:hypothetical protein MCC93_25220 [Morococcus cerebrosus]|uniref:Uncharacterized protein n=1 Tax=Morococcus cerebrosus TaxID=1056807 RepID=A0A0C1GW09_9NEIS|nr:hypothetical protein MCC93_25220 [Morococcus cerebrosus]
MEVYHKIRHFICLVQIYYIVVKGRLKRHPPDYLPFCTAYPP